MFKSITFESECKVIVNFLSNDRFRSFDCLLSTVILADNWLNASLYLLNIYTDIIFNIYTDLQMFTKLIRELFYIPTITCVPIVFHITRPTH